MWKKLEPVKKLYANTRVHLSPSRAKNAHNEQPREGGGGGRFNGERTLKYEVLLRKFSRQSYQLPA